MVVVEVEGAVVPKVKVGLEEGAATEVAPVVVGLLELAPKLNGLFVEAPVVAPDVLPKVNELPGLFSVVTAELPKENGFGFVVVVAPAPPNRGLPEAPEVAVDPPKVNEGFAALALALELVFAVVADPKIGLEAPVPALALL